MSQLMKYSLLTGDDTQTGVDTEDLDKLLELGDMLATSRPDVILHIQGPALQKWDKVSHPEKVDRFE